MLKRGGGVCGSLWPWSEGGGRISCVNNEGEGAPGYVGGGQVKFRWWWFVALLIDEGAPLGGGRAPWWRARPWVKGAWWFFFSFFLRVLQLGVDDKTPLAVIHVA